jgi:fluoroacetyl-CoA thioesterase
MPNPGLPAARPDPRAAPFARAAFDEGLRPPGLVRGSNGATIGMSVAESMTARSVGSGDTDVLATPVIARMVEQAAMIVLRGWLPEDLTTVGTSLQLVHEAPTALRGQIEVAVWLEPGTSRTLQFGFDAEDGMGIVARGTHTRVIVDRATFLSKSDDRRAAAHTRRKRGLG